MLLAELPDVLVHDITAPGALTPEMDDDPFALLGDVEEVLLLDHVVLAVALCELIAPLCSLFLHLLQAFPPQLFEVVLFQSIEATDLLIEGLFPFLGGINDDLSD